MTGPDDLARRDRQHLDGVRRAAQLARRQQHQANLDRGDVEGLDEAGDQRDGIEQQRLGNAASSISDQREQRGGERRHDQGALALEAVDERTRQRLHEQARAEQDGDHTADAEGAAAQLVREGDHRDGAGAVADPGPGHPEQELPRFGRAGEGAIAVDAIGECAPDRLHGVPGNRDFRG